VRLLRLPPDIKKIGQIDLAELFDLSKDEAAAYSDLYLMTNGNFKAIQQLADKGQLAPAELTSVKKLVAAKDEFERGIGTMKVGTAKIVRAEPEFAAPIDKKTLEALGKLSLALDQIWEFPNATVFAEPRPAANRGQWGGGRARGGGLE